jgi:hypothetical protein
MMIPFTHSASARRLSKGALAIRRWCIARQAAPRAKQALALGFEEQSKVLLQRYETAKQSAKMAEPSGRYV